MLRSTALAALFIAGAVLPASPAEEGFLPLLAGNTTEGWIQRGGKAAYAVEKRVLVGRTALNTPNSFLCPPKEYADFILEFEVWVDPTINSGVQIRSESSPDYRNGIVHGYQIEIDPSDRAWSGGVYDEQRRGWLANPKDDEKARKAFKVGQWNRYRVHAEGDRIRTWVNGVPVADLVDGMTRSGFIGFQVHAAKEAGLAVKWRNIRIRELPRAATGLALNTLSEQERAEGWQLLWDGRTTWGWRGLAQKELPKDRWEAKDGELLTVPAPVSEAATKAAPVNADIITDRKFSDFELALEFRLSPGANSGIKYFVRDALADGGASSVGFEYQLIDDSANADAKRGENGARSLASLYDVMPAAANKPVRPMGEWNQARIVARGRHVEHWLNGVKVLELERGSEDFRARVAKSKHRVWPGYGDEANGPILLQYHGGGVAFRNVKIRETHP